jgi:hypothetical protein
VLDSLRERKLCVSNPHVYRAAFKAVGLKTRNRRLLTSLYRNDYADQKRDVIRIDIVDGRPAWYRPSVRPGRIPKSSLQCSGGRA